MSGPAEEVDAAMDMAADAARELYKKNPQHLLLKYIAKSDDDATWREFINTYARPTADKSKPLNSIEMAHVYVNYKSALEAAVAQT